MKTIFITGGSTGIGAASVSKAEKSEGRKKLPNWYISSRQMPQASAPADTILLMVDLLLNRCRPEAAICGCSTLVPVRPESQFQQYARMNTTGYWLERS